MNNAEWHRISFYSIGQDDQLDALVDDYDREEAEARRQYMEDRRNDQRVRIAELRRRRRDHEAAEDEPSTSAPAPAPAHLTAPGPSWTFLDSERSIMLPFLLGVMLGIVLTLVSLNLMGLI